MVQTYTFAVKVSDADTFNIDPAQILQKENRTKYQSLYFLAINFQNLTILDSIALIFILVKVVDGLRFIRKLNVIFLALIQSVNLMSIFLVLLIGFNLGLVPLAQAIWGS
jgi:hypothetical protein